MKLAVTVLSVVVAALANAVAAAECPREKQEVTIVNPGGKVHVICAASAAIPHLGGSSDVVIAASCPCFTAELIEAAMSEKYETYCELHVGQTGWGLEPARRCEAVGCHRKGGTGESFFQAGAGAGPPWLSEKNTKDPCVFKDGGPFGKSFPTNNWCGISIGDDHAWRLPAFEGPGEDLITPEQGAACVAILKAFVTTTTAP